MRGRQIDRPEMSSSMQVRNSKHINPPVKVLRILRSLAIALILGLVLPGVIRATVIVRLNILELTLNSTKIIEGTVISSRGILVPRGGVCTEITLAVSETLRGKHEDEAVFIIPGGSLDGKKFSIIAGIPKFRLGESVVVFLAGTNDRIVVGLSQGKFSVESIGSEKYAVQNTKDVCLLDAKASLKIASGGPVTDWEDRFTSSETKETANMKPGDGDAYDRSPKESQLIKGGFLRVPLDIFKDTVRECNPDNYSSADLGQ